MSQKKRKKPVKSRAHEGHSPVREKGKTGRAHLPAEREKAFFTQHHAHASSLAVRFSVSLVLTVPVLLFSGMVQEWFPFLRPFAFVGQNYLLLFLSSIIYFYGGWPFLAGFVKELRRKQPGMMTLVALAVTAAWAYSTAVLFGLPGAELFWELATLIDIMLLGHWLETRALAGSSGAIETLKDLLPSRAHKMTAENRSTEVPLEELAVGDRILVKTGERIPADGTVMSGESSVDESMLTGESEPVVKKAGSSVLAGSINHDGGLTVQIKKPASENYINQLIGLVRGIEKSKTPVQGLADRISFILTATALFSGLLSFGLWVFLSNRGLAFGLERAVAVLVIACPHALGLAIPLVAAVSAGLAARSGVLIKSREAFESARKINAVLFDKTGTLTQGHFGVTDIFPLNKLMDENDILKYAASVESHSSHPMARSISSASPQIYRADNFKTLPGQGVEARINNRNVKVVNTSYLKKAGIRLSGTDLSHYTAQGKSILYLLLENEPAGIIALSDRVRPEAKTAVSLLKKMGIKSIMLSGDHRETAKWVAELVGIDEVYSEMLPQDKLKKIKEMQEQGLVLAMTGDGINDAPALAQADLGIAIGAGTDAAAATADVILVRSDPMDVASLIRLARLSYGKMVQNLAWALGYNVLALPLAAGVFYSLGIVLSPALGAVLMSLSTIIVAFNSRFIRVIVKK